MKHLELLDKAIHLNRGKWDTSFEYLVYSNGNFHHKDVNGLSSYTWEPSWFHMTYRARAKELGYFNGFRWGVEYPTSGQKPDLDGAVRVNVKDKYGSWDGGALRVKSWSWENVSAFRIVDLHYKPTDISYIPLEQRPKVHPTGDIGRSSGCVGAAESTGRIGRGPGPVGVNSNHIGESDEKAAKAARIVSDIAVASPRLAISWTRRLLPELFDNSVAPDNSADWYDYENQAVTKLPPIGAEFELWPFFHLCEVVAHHDGGAVVYDKKALEYVHIKWGNFRCRPLDFNRQQEEPSPELSFHLSNAFNELQASARLLSEDDPRRASIVSLAGGVSAVKEVV